MNVKKSLIGEKDLARSGPHNNAKKELFTVNFILTCLNSNFNVFDVVVRLLILCGTELLELHLK